MGVPAFYKWLLRKYPKVVVPVREETPITVTTETGEVITQPVDASMPNPNGQEFDNFYLDMNGIIHPASHPVDGPAPATEDDMFIAILEYIDRVFACVRPRKLLFMAIDGVAPRAKMNQQRSRRFRAAKEADDKEKALAQFLKEREDNGIPITLPPSHQFDSNVITPGTPFMSRLLEFLHYHIHKKITTDQAWKNIKVILSDASVPGEGEHKIMEFIRQQRLQQNYDPNTSHVIHGLDADLIMLSLATHEPHFSILREEVSSSVVARCFICGNTGHSMNDCTSNGTVSEDFSNQNSSKKPFEFAHINVLREYLFHEMSIIGSDFQLERFIDDFILMCFFVGNDFLPHLPTLDIHEGAIDMLMDLYKRMFHQMGGYLTDQGNINFHRVTQLMQAVGTIEDNIFRSRKAQEDKMKRRKQQDKLNIQNKEMHKEHLRLIHTLSDTTSAYIKATLNRAGRSDLLDQPTFKNMPIIPQIIENDAFRIRDKGVGGLRVLLPNVDQQSAQKLHLLDKIRTFYENPTKKGLKLQHLNGFERHIAHTYCTELGLKHDSQGQEPNRYILVTLEDNDIIEDQDNNNEDNDNNNDDDVALSNDKEVKEVLKEIKDKMRKREDDLVEAQIDEVKLEQQGWKERYYTVKLSGTISPQKLAKDYLIGVAWVMKYYYEGCASWTWYFEYHYAPFASDLTVDAIPDINFELGHPFKPIEQLMAVLPSRSSHAVPQPCAKLMIDESSPIADFYPRTFPIDLNGKKQLWQAVVLLPFIHAKRLLEAVASVSDLFTEQEKQRNCWGPNLLFVHHDYRDHFTLNPSEKRKTIKYTNDDILTEVEMNAIAAQRLRAELDDDQENVRILNETIEKSQNAKNEIALQSRRLVDLPEDANILNDVPGLCGFIRSSNYSINSALCQSPVFYGHRHDFDLSPFQHKTVVVEYYLPAYRQHVPQLLSGVRLPPNVLQPSEGPNHQRFTSVPLTQASPMVLSSATFRVVEHYLPRETRPSQHHHQQQQYQQNQQYQQHYQSRSVTEVPYSPAVRHSLDDDDSFQTKRDAVARYPDPLRNQYTQQQQASSSSYQAQPPPVGGFNMYSSSSYRQPSDQGNRPSYPVSYNNNNASAREYSPKPYRPDLPQQYSPQDRNVGYSRQQFSESSYSPRNGPPLPPSGPYPNMQHRFGEYPPQQPYRDPRQDNARPPTQPYQSSQYRPRY